MVELDFISRCNNLFKNDVKREDIKRFLKKRLYYENNKVNLLEKHRNYCRTKKGKIAARRRTCISGLRFREKTRGLAKEELEKIRLFYANRPKGYEVDHIIPLSKGGQHIFSNLQYLKPFENRQKGNDLFWKPVKKGMLEKINKYIKKNCYQTKRIN